GGPSFLRPTSRGATLLMNPPFGVQVKGADARFLRAAMSIAGVDVIYSIHLKKEKNRKYLQKLVKDDGWEVVEMHQTKMILPRLYEFHEKKRKEIEVDIYRIIPSR
ncbi:MAG: RNA methyltransferase, partial [Candidatus Lokiarchaeota archaeon]|nr:RNA methyltransferase [Candidatus Lokiarchaeota archaeon]